MVARARNISNDPLYLHVPNGDVTARALNNYGCGYQEIEEFQVITTINDGEHAHVPPAEVPRVQSE